VRPHTHTHTHTHTPGLEEPSDGQIESQKLGGPKAAEASAKSRKRGLRSFEAQRVDTARARLEDEARGRGSRTRLEDEARGRGSRLEDEARGRG